MANAFVLRNAAVLINGVNLSDHVKEVEVVMTAADIDVTAMGANGHQHLAGIRDDKFSITFFSDFASASVHATLMGPFASGTSFVTVQVWANGSTSSATNGCFQGTCIILDYSPINGGVGDASMTQIEFPVNGTISYATS